MPLFPSRGWMEAFCAEVRDHADAPAIAASLAGIYRFVVTPAGLLSREERYQLEVIPVDGERPEVVVIDDDAVAARLTLTADYNRWRQLVDGELDIGLAVMLRRLKVSGDLGALTRGLSNVKPLLDAVNAVETEWLE